MKWEMVKLGDTATFINGYPFKPTDWSDTGLEIIRIQNLTKSSSESNLFDGEIPKKYLVKEGDLLISWSATLGIYEWSGNDAWVNQHIFKVVFDKIDINKKYFKFLIGAKLHELEAQVHGATMKHITKGKFDSLLVPIPPLHIQEQIANTLDKADALRRKDQVLLTKYDELAQAIFYDMFGDPVKNEKGWEVKKLKELCIQITDGTHFSPPSVPIGIPYITAKHIKKHGIDFYSNPTFVDEIHHKEIFARCTPQKGDVLYIKDGATTGLAAINECDFEFSMLSSLALIKPKQKVLDNIYLKYWLNDGRVKNQYLNEFMAGAAIQRFTLSKINQFNVSLPPFELQQLFSARIGLLEKTQKIGWNNKEKSDSLFGKLLNDYFS